MNRDAVAIDRYGRPYSDLTADEQEEVDNHISDLRERSLAKLRGEGF
jgi:hypothetical protein